MLVIFCSVLAILCGSLVVCLLFRGAAPPPPTRFEVRAQHQEQLIKQLEAQLLASMRRTEEAFLAGFWAREDIPTAWTFQARDAQETTRARHAWGAWCKDWSWPSC